jgi:hypothetical protein
VGEQEVTDDDGGGDDGDGAASEGSPVGSASPAQADDPLARLLAGGLAHLGELARAARTPAGDGGSTARAEGPFQVARDPTTGETFLRVRVPDAEALNRVLEATAGLIESLRRDR